MNEPVERGGFWRDVQAALLRSRITRPFMLRPRLLIGIFVGLCVGLIVDPQWRLTTRLLLAWNAGIVLYIALTLVMMLRDDLDRLHQRAAVPDEGRFVILILSIVAAVFSIAAIVAQLAETKDRHIHAHNAARCIMRMNMPQSGASGRICRRKCVAGLISPIR